MNDTDKGLPELPTSFGVHCVTDSVRVMREPGYTADQMRAMYEKGKQDALSAASGKAVAWQFKDSEGRWCGFHSDKHRDDTIASGAWEVRSLYLHPATVTDEDVERAKRAWYTYGISENERFRAALSSFANKENRND